MFDTEKKKKEKSPTWMQKMKGRQAHYQAHFLPSSS